MMEMDLQQDYMLEFWNNLIEDIRTIQFNDKQINERINPYFNYQLFKRRDDCNHSLLAYCVIYDQIQLIEYLIQKINFQDLEEEYQNDFSNEILGLIFQQLRYIKKSIDFLIKLLNLIYNSSFYEMIDLFIAMQKFEFFDNCNFFILDILFDDIRVYEILKTFFSKSTLSVSQEILKKLEHNLFNFIWQHKEIQFLQNKEQLYFLPEIQYNILNHLINENDTKTISDNKILEIKSLLYSTNSDKQNQFMLIFLKGDMNLLNLLMTYNFDIIDYQDSKNNNILHYISMNKYINLQEKLIIIKYLYNQQINQYQKMLKVINKEYLLPATVLTTYYSQDSNKEEFSQLFKKLIPNESGIYGKYRQWFQRDLFYLFTQKNQKKFIIQQKKTKQFLKFTEIYEFHKTSMKQILRVKDQILIQEFLKNILIIQPVYFMNEITVLGLYQVLLYVLNLYMHEQLANEQYESCFKDYQFDRKINFSIMNMICRTIVMVNKKFQNKSFNLVLDEFVQKYFNVLQHEDKVNLVNQLCLIVQKLYYPQVGVYLNGITQILLQENESINKIFKEIILFSKEKLQKKSGLLLYVALKMQNQQILEIVDPKPFQIDSNRNVWEMKHICDLFNIFPKNYIFAIKHIIKKFPLLEMQFFSNQQQLAEVSSQIQTKKYLLDCNNDECLGIIKFLLKLAISKNQQLFNVKMYHFCLINDSESITFLITNFQYLPHKNQLFKFLLKKIINEDRQDDLDLLMKFLIPLYQKQKNVLNDPNILKFQMEEHNFVSVFLILKCMNYNISFQVNDLSIYNQRKAEFGSIEIYNSFINNKNLLIYLSDNQSQNYHNDREKLLYYIQQKYQYIYMNEIFQQVFLNVINHNDYEMAFNMINHDGMLENSFYIKNNILFVLLQTLKSKPKDISYFLNIFQYIHLIYQKQGVPNFSEEHNILINTGIIYLPINLINTFNYQYMDYCVKKITTKKYIQYIFLKIIREQQFDLFQYFLELYFRNNENTKLQSYLYHQLVNFHQEYALQCLFILKNNFEICKKQLYYCFVKNNLEMFKFIYRKSHIKLQDKMEPIRQYFIDLYMQNSKYDFHEIIFINMDIKTFQDIILKLPYSLVGQFVNFHQNFFLKNSTQIQYQFFFENQKLKILLNTLINNRDSSLLAEGGIGVALGAMVGVLEQYKSIEPVFQTKLFDQLIESYYIGYQNALTLIGQRLQIKKSRAYIYLVQFETLYQFNQSNAYQEDLIESLRQITQFVFAFHQNHSIDNIFLSKFLKILTKLNVIFPALFEDQYKQFKNFFSEIDQIKYDYKLYYYKLKYYNNLYNRVIRENSLIIKQLYEEIQDLQIIKLNENQIQKIMQQLLVLNQPKVSYIFLTKFKNQIQNHQYLVKFIVQFIKKNQVDIFKKIIVDFEEIDFQNYEEQIIDMIIKLNNNAFLPILLEKKLAFKDHSIFTKVFQSQNYELAVYLTQKFIIQINLVGKKCNSFKFIQLILESEFKNNLYLKINFILSNNIIMNQTKKANQDFIINMFQIYIYPFYTNVIFSNNQVNINMFQNETENIFHLISQNKMSQTFYIILEFIYYFISKNNLSDFLQLVQNLFEQRDQQGYSVYDYSIITHFYEVFAFLKQYNIYIKQIQNKNEKITQRFFILSLQENLNKKEKIKIDANFDKYFNECLQNYLKLIQQEKSPAFIQKYPKDIIKQGKHNQHFNAQQVIEFICFSGLFSQNSDELCLQVINSIINLQLPTCAYLFFCDYPQMFMNDKKLMKKLILLLSNKHDLLKQFLSLNKKLHLNYQPCQIQKKFQCYEKFFINLKIQDLLDIFIQRQQLQICQDLIRNNNNLLLSNKDQLGFNRLSILFNEITHQEQLQELVLLHTKIYPVYFLYYLNSIFDLQQEKKLLKELIKNENLIHLIKQIQEIQHLLKTDQRKFKSLISDEQYRLNFNKEVFELLQQNFVQFEINSCENLLILQQVSNEESYIIGTLQITNQLIKIFVHFQIIFDELNNLQQTYNLFKNIVFQITNDICQQFKYAIKDEIIILQISKIFIQKGFEFNDHIVSQLHKLYENIIQQNLIGNFFKKIIFQSKVQKILK